MNKTIDITVSISPVSDNDTSGGTTVCRIPRVDPESGWLRTENELIKEAINRACEKLYGRGTFWNADSGLPGYGQVFRSCSTGGASSVTYRAALDVDLPDIGDEHRAALAQEMAEYAELVAESETEY